MTSLEIRFEEALAYTAALSPETFATFRRHIDPDWIEEALLSTGTATLRRRRLPGEQVVWLVLGMALMRDRPIHEVVRQLDLALPLDGGPRTVAPSAVAQARARLGAEPMLQRLETIRSKSPVTVAQEMWGLLTAYNLIRLEMERIADEIGVPPLRISFVAALRLIVDEWNWSANTSSPGAIPRHLQDLRDKIRVFVLPPRRSERAYPRAVKIKMRNYARTRPSTGGVAK